MAIPNVNMSITDGALGIISEESDLDQLSVGTSSAGTIGTLYGFTNLDDLKGTLGSGPLVEAMALKLSEPGHGIVYGLRLTGSVAGANGAVTRNGTGVDPGATLSGTPLDQYDGIIKIIVGGARGTATFQYSLDGGDTFSAEIVTAATYAVPNTGLTFNFAVGTYVANDTYTWTSTAPYYSTTDLNTGMTSALGYPTEWGLLHVVGTPSNAAGTATVFAALDTIMTNAEAAFRFSRAVMEAADDTDGNLISSFAALASVGGRTSVAAGFAELVSPITARIHKRPAAWPIMARAGAVPISQDLAWIDAGPLSAIRSLYRDEAKTPALDIARFMTLRTVIGKQGFYNTNPKTMAAANSDFGLLQYGRVIDRMAKVVREALLPYLSGSVRVNPTGAANAGTIYELDARAIEQDVDSQATAALVAPVHASDVVIQVNRTDNILSTKKLRVSGRCVPLGYLKQIDATIGFTNPALSIAA